MRDMVAKWVRFYRYIKSRAVFTVGGCEMFVKVKQVLDRTFIIHTTTVAR